MYNQLRSILNIKPGESRLVMQLFLIQFFIGIATAFLFTGSLALFLSGYPIVVLPEAYVLSSILLVFINQLYAKMDARYSSLKLLRIIILFSAASVLLFRLFLSFTGFKYPVFLLAAWNIVIYMLVGYAFWGLTSLLFNVRESKRLFSLVGAGDVPAKMMGYLSVYIIVPYTGSINLLWISIIFFLLAFIIIEKVGKNKTVLLKDPSDQHESSDTNHSGHSKSTGIINRFFHNRLIFVITALTFITNIVFAFIDFTFLSVIKLNYATATQMAAFIGIFFAVVRLMALLIKLLLSSRLIARLGLVNSLLLAPMILLLLDIFLIFSTPYPDAALYLFGLIVLVSEVLRSTLQEPVFFILFQPLGPHSRLKGHLIAKGYSLQFALLIVGSFLYVYLQKHSGVSVISLAKLLLVLFACWLGMVYAVKKEYFQTLKEVLKRGYFTGADLFLNDDSTIQILMQKITTGNAPERIHSLSLLEKAGIKNMSNLWLEQLTSKFSSVIKYVIDKLIENNIAAALPAIKEQYEIAGNEDLKAHLTRAVFYFEGNDLNELKERLSVMEMNYKRQAITGLILRKSPGYMDIVVSELRRMAESTDPEEKRSAIEIITETNAAPLTDILNILLDDQQAEIYKPAMEAVGKMKSFPLLDKLIKVSLKWKAYHSLQRSLILFGDSVYQEKHLVSITSQHKDILDILIKAAAKVSGEYSEKFLISALNDTNIGDNEVITSLWQRKTVLPSSAEIRLQRTIDLNLQKSTRKLEYFFSLSKDSNFKLLEEAFVSEIEQDLQIIVNGFGLMYDKENIRRIIELLAANNKEKINNAIELLELVISKKYFLQVIRLIEFLEDYHSKRTVLNSAKALSIPDIFEEILNTNTAGCNTWTRTVACYLLPCLKNPELVLKIIKSYNTDTRPISGETKGYVLSLLNHKK